MNKKIKKILVELYEIDPSLAQYEKKLIEVIEFLVQNKPDIEVDNNFYSRLKEELFADNRKKENIIKHKYMNLKNQLYIGAAVLTVGVFLVVFSTSLFYPRMQSDSETSFKLSLNPQISSLESNAFGSLSGLSVGADGSATPADSEEAIGLGAGGATARSEGATLQSAPGKMIAPYEPYIYNYILSDDSFELSEKELTVLKKQKKSLDGEGLSSVFRGLDLGIMDLSEFDNLELNNFSLLEDKKQGYSIYINLAEGNISIGQNWSSWQEESARCQSEECLEGQRIKVPDVPDDEDLIRIADNFIADKKIDISSYAEPRVDDAWRQRYEQSLDKDNFYVPNNISVIYPLKIMGKELYDQSGSYSGLRVNIDIKNNKVSNLYGLEAANYQTSDYEAETDKQKIIEIAKKGGINSYRPEEGKEVDIVLGSPKMSYVRTWNYGNEGGFELMVPSLIFPVEEVPEGVRFYRQTVIIPLVKEMLETDNGPGIEPMPLLRGGAESAFSEKEE